MGTRADFYVGKGKQAEWLGSIAFDGYVDGITLTLPEREMFGVHKRADFPEGKHLFDAATEQEYRERVAQFFANRDDATLPAQGWPWPWDDSHTTDRSYTFADGRVWGSCWGCEWFDPHDGEPDGDDLPEVEFPNMKSIQKVAFGDRSGLLVVAGPAQPQTTEPGE